MYRQDMVRKDGKVCTVRASESTGVSHLQHASSVQRSVECALLLERCVNNA